MSGRTGVYRYWRVDRSTRLETEQLTTVLGGGRITRNNLTALKESGELPTVGVLAIGDDLVRIYYVVTSEDGAEEQIPLATMHAFAESVEYGPAARSSSLQLYSVLLDLQDAAIKTPLTIAAGANAIDEAAALCTAVGLPVVATPSARTLSTAASWDAGTSKLAIVNYLLDIAGYWSARTDGWGRVVMLPYEEPTRRTATWAFADGDNAIFLPRVTIDTGADRVPNVCVLTCTNPSDAPIVGSYTNADPASPYSTVARGREIALVETVDDATDAADLDARAQTRLLAATSATETVKIQHAYAPVLPGDVVSLDWAQHSLSLRAAIQSQDISLTPSAMTTTTAKRVWSQ